MMVIRRSFLLAVLLLVVYGYFFPRWASWNENSRFDLVLSWVDDHTLTIDRFVDNTGDYAFYRGHYYSDKAPGMFFLGVPSYLIFRSVFPRSILSRLETAASTDRALSGTLRADGSGLTPDRLNFFIALTFTTALTGLLPAVALGVLSYWVAGWLGCPENQRLLATLVSSCATILFPYANSLIGHVTSAFFLFAAFTVLFAIRRCRLSPHWEILAGFLIGYAAINEYQTVLIGSVLGLYAVTRRQWPGLCWGAVARLIGGALPPLAALGIYDLAAFGTILPVGYFHSTLWANVHDQGFVSLTFPHPDALWGITFGAYRGLFFLSPVLLFAIPGYVRMWRARDHRAEFWVLVGAPMLFFLFNASSAMWQGGFAVGPRYLVPSLPFLSLAAGIGLGQAWTFRVLRPVALAATLWSFFAVWAEAIGGQSFPDYTPNPLFNYSLPRLMAGDIARNLGMFAGLRGWSSLLPLLAFGLVAMVLLTWPLPPEQSRRDEVERVPGSARWAAP